MRKIALCLLVAAPLAAPAMASAADSAPVARVQTIDLRSVEAAVRLSPNDGGAYIELAQAYAKAGRPGDARDAYRRALALDNVTMETRSGDAIWSHQVAQRALASEVTLTAR